jgi:signal peptidase II
MKKYAYLTFFIVLTDAALKFLLPNKTRNYGAAFDILENYRISLIIVSLLALILFIYLFFKSQENKLGLSLLIAGTLSNLLDRLFLGYVVDFIPFFGLFTFNLGDLSNVLGVIILIATKSKFKSVF